MGEYHLYHLREDGRIWRRLDLACDTDAEALVIAEEASRDNGVELWEGLRKVANISARGRAPLG